MRKWIALDCSECGKDDGYWKDVVEGPETPENYAIRIEQKKFMHDLFGPIIKEQLEAITRFEAIASPQKHTVTFPIRRSQ